MSLYKKSTNKLIPIKEKKIELEKDIQIITEQSLDDIFGLQFISTEFLLKNLRIDTLAFDEETKSFVIIEYKKDRSFTVIDQGYAYLALLLNNKADFILEYNQKFNKNLGKNDIDWSQSKVIFIAQSFTLYQKEAIGFQDLPIELWEVKSYETDLILFNQIKPSEKSESIKKIAKSPDMNVVSKEIRHYTVEGHIKESWNNTKELFEELSTRLIEIDPKLEVKPVKSYIGFRLGAKNLVNVKPKSTKITIELLRTQPQDIKDPEGRVSYFNNSFKYYNQHVSLFDIENTEDIDYAIMLVRQVYKKLIE